MDAYYQLLPLADLLLAASLGLMAWGLFASGGRPRVAAVGGVAYSLFLLIQTPLLYAEGSWDTASASLLAFVFFALVGWRLWAANEYNRPLRFALVAALVGTLIYFPFIRSPFLGLMAIYVVAVQSIAWVNLLGFDFSIGGYEAYGGWLYHFSKLASENVSLRILLDGEPSGIALIMECTGLQVMALFACIILASWAPRRKRAIALLVNLPALHLLNLFRNGMILYLVPVKGWDFEFVHGVLGITISLIMIGVLALWTLLYLPTLHTELIDTAKYVLTGRHYIPPVPTKPDEGEGRPPAE